MVYANFAERLRALMDQRDIGVRELARRMPCDPGYVSQLRHGRERPSREFARRLDDILDAGGELAEAAPKREVGEITRAVVSRHNGSSALLADESVELVEFMRRAELSDVGAGTLDALYGAVDRLCRDYPAKPAPQLRDRCKATMRYTLGLLDGRTTLAQHRELLVSAGWLAALLGCVEYDTGDRVAAEVARRMASRLGEQAGHGEIVAWSWETAAWFALIEGRYPETVKYSEAGLQYAGTSSAAVQLSLQAGRGYARMGDSAARAALRTGRAVLDRLPTPEHPEHHFVFDGSKYEFYVATILTWLGRDDTVAEEHAREVVRQCEESGGWPTRLGTTRINLGLIAGRRGDLDEAIELGTSALQLERRSAELLPRAEELYRELARSYPQESLVTAYRDQLIEEHRALPPPDQDSPLG